jgi:ABC-type sugar transport system substrate-binding protein/AraC-like DNA-binding protein
MLFGEDRLLIFWNTRGKTIPTRPRHPERYPQHDARHWYDSEYAGWGIEKTNIPESPGDGPQGKKVACLMPGMQHPYHLAFAEGLEKIALRAGVRLIRLTADMTREGQDEQVRRVIREKPDLAILVPISSEACTEWVRAINAEKIPIIVSNFLPSKDAYRYILSWCGPDDWGQFRLLSRKFAELMGYKGGYAILRHLPGTSCYDARTFSVITELRTAAPRMRLLAMGPADDKGQFDPQAAEARVSGWLGEFGLTLKGIVSSDDCFCQQGINEALRKAGRQDIILVSAGSTPAGMQLVKEGKLQALTFQSAQADGALPMKVAIDWFNGLSIEPINYLPKYIITRDNIDDFIAKKPEFLSVSLELLTRAILNGEEEGVDSFFEDAYQSFLSSEVMTTEFFRGFSIEVLSTLVHLVKMNDMDEQPFLSDYESLYKNLFNQKTPKNTMEWMKRLSLSVMRAIGLERKTESQVERIIRYVNRNFSEPLSLKTLSCQFDLSAPYLGRLFHREVGKSFTTYLNELRLRKAEELLRYTTLKASEIAKRTGYANVNYFYTLFKQYKGCYPSESKAREVHSLKPK